jgi:NitT/TauT family transport system substrate-binding protein
MKIILAIAGALLAAQAASAATKLNIGTVPTIGDGALICAIEKGWFKEQDLDVELTSFRSGADMVPQIARGDIPLMGGGLSASFFNAIADGMPIRYFANRAQSPVHHQLVLRKDIAAKVKSVKDLKGLRLATTGAGAQTEYETAKVLESGGLTIDDVEMKSLGMPETVLALTSGAIDGAVLVPPLDRNAIQAGHVAFLDPDSVIGQKLEVSGMFYNLDWANKNRDVLDRFTVAYIKGARYYLQAVRKGPNHSEVVDYLIKHLPIKDRSIYEGMNWAEVNPDGAIVPENIVDMQNFYMKRGYLKKVVPVDAIADMGPVQRALAKVGPFGK